MAESTDDTPDLISPALLDLLAVFEGPLAEVRFPGVDSTSLRHLIDQVRDSSEKLEALKSQFEGLQNTLTEAQTKLVRAAEQGLGYARVYAAGDPELSERLGSIVLASEEPKQRRRKLEVANPEAGEAIRMPPKRGRKPKSADPEAKPADPEAATGS